MKFPVLSLLALFALQETPWTPFNDPENRRQPERVSAIDVGHYRITIRLDERIPPPVVEGRVDIDLALTAATDTIELDADEKTTITVIESGTKKLEFIHAGRKLAVALGRKGAPGEKLSLAITYTARPTAGLFFITPEPGRKSRPWQVWTQGETEYNHHWFPCYDYPNDRATSEVIVTVREKYQTISNGTLAKSEVVPGGWRTDHWKMEIPHVVYLTSLVAGEFDVVEESDGATKPLPIRYFVPKGWCTPDEIRQTFGRTPSMVKFFSEKTGVPYPYPKYDQVVVEDFTWGGMENITATTLHPGTVVPRRSWGDRDSEGLIAHELAHQWFGDLVTCRTWAHAWLNESFATYMTALWMETERGREGLVAEMEDELGWYLAEAKNEYVRPTACEFYTTPDDVFDAHIYPKGAWILHMLHNRLGSDAWWKGIQKYLTKHRAGLVTTDDFRVAMEEATGDKLQGFFDQWIWKAGHPELKATAHWDPESRRLTIKIEQVQQARKLAWKELETAVPYFEFPLDVEIETAAGRRTDRIEVKGPSTQAMYPLDSEPLIIDIDRDNAILKTLEFQRTPAQLIYQLEHDDQPWHRWWAASKLAGSHDGIAALRTALQNDRSNTVRIAAAKALGATGTPDARAALLEKPPSDPRVRRAVIEALGNHAKDAANELETFFKDDPSPACRAAAAAALGKRGGLTRMFLQWEDFVKDDVLMPGILAGMLESNDPSLVPASLRALERDIPTMVRSRAAEVLGEALAKDAEARKGTALKKFTALFDDRNYRVRRSAIRSSGGLGEEAAEALERRIPKEPEKRLVKEIRDQVRKIRTPKRP